MSSFQRGYGEILPDWVPEEEDWVTEREAKRREFTRLCQGALAGAILATGAFVGSAAFGGDTADWDGTGCQIIPVEGRAHLAEILCRNAISRTVTRVWADISIPGMTVQVLVIHQQGERPDQFIITPPDGYIVEPPTLTLDEWTEGVFRIYAYAGA